MFVYLLHGLFFLEEHIGNSRDPSFGDMVLNATNGRRCHIVISCVQGELKNVSIDVNCLSVYCYSNFYLEIIHNFNVYLAFFRFPSKVPVTWFWILNKYLARRNLFLECFIYQRSGRIKQ